MTQWSVTSAGSAYEELTMKTRFATLFAFITAAVAVSAQPRMEGTTSPFTYEAVGATPSLSLGKVRHANDVNGIAAKQASKAPATEPTRAVPVGAFTYGTPGAAPIEEVEEPAATAEHQSQESAR
jgi:hypothetical protein